MPLNPQQRQEILEKIEAHLREKAPDFPHPWQFVQRLKVKQEIEQECKFFLDLFDQELAKRERKSGDNNLTYEELEILFKLVDRPAPQDR